MSESGCVHLNHFKSTKGTQFYRLIHSYFVACTSSEARLRKAQSCICFVCNDADPRIHSCLHCVYFGCHGNHMNEHCVSNKHYLTVELSYGFINCVQCGDYVHDIEFLEIAKENKIKQARSLNIGLSWRPWFVTDAEASYLKRFSKSRRISAKSTFGLRGLVNLGQTCFMNSIIQTLVHTPLLRAYFFAEKHKCETMLDAEKHLEPCLMCEFANLFQDFYSGSNIPLMLHRLLHFMWNHARHLSCYKQQDAHEFFAATLDLLHLHCQRSMPNSVSPQRIYVDTNGSPLPSTRLYKAERCDCIIDQIFTGDLQSDIVCQICNTVSTTIDPIRDIAIDFPDNSAGSCSLLDCLKSYTSAELGLIVKCKKCEADKESTKQLSFKSLPVVFSFHLKRFESTKWRKITKKISFPIEIDMSEFMSKTRASRQSTEVDSDETSDPLETEDYRYSLFAVINHHGKTLEGGHYTAYVRHYKDFWVLCNDEVITLASLADVLKSEGYLLFYHKHILQYE